MKQQRQFMMACKRAQTSCHVLQGMIGEGVGAAAASAGMQQQAAVMCCKVTAGERQRNVAVGTSPRLQRHASE